MSLFRPFLLFALSLLFAAQALAQQLPIPPALAAKSWLLLEIGSGPVLRPEQPDEPLAVLEDPPNADLVLGLAQEVLLARRADEVVVLVAYERHGAYLDDGVQIEICHCLLHTSS